MIWKGLGGQLTQASPCCSSCSPVPSSGQVLNGRVIPMYLRNAVLSLESWTHSTCSTISGRSHKCRVKTGWIWAHIGSSAALRSWLFRCLFASLHVPIFSKCFTVDTCYFFFFWTKRTFIFTSVAIKDTIKYNMQHASSWFIADLADYSLRSLGASNWSLRTINSKGWQTISGQWKICLLYYE